MSLTKDLTGSFTNNTTVARPKKVYIPLNGARSRKRTVVGGIGKGSAESGPGSYNVELGDWLVWAVANNVVDLGSVIETLIIAGTIDLTTVPGSNTPIKDYLILTSGVTATGNNLLTNDRYFVELTGATAAVTAFLPATPVAGDEFFFTTIDGVTNATTINGNGNNIEGAATLVTASGESNHLVFNGTEWKEFNAD